MAADEFFRAVLERLKREPFQPFTVQLLDGRHVEFDRPSLAIRDGAAAGIARGGSLVRLDSYEVKQIVDAR